MIQFNINFHISSESMGAHPLHDPLQDELHESCRIYEDLTMLQTLRGPCRIYGDLAGSTMGSGTDCGCRVRSEIADKYDYMHAGSSARRS